MNQASGGDKRDSRRPHRVPRGTARLCREVLSVISLSSADGETSRELRDPGASADVFAATPEELDEALAAVFRLSCWASPPADASTVTAHRLVMRIDLTRPMTESCPSWRRRRSCPCRLRVPRSVSWTLAEPPRGPRVRSPDLRPYLAAGRRGDAVPRSSRRWASGAVLGDSDPGHADDRAHARCRLSRRLRVDAMPLFTWVLAERERVLGPSHPAYCDDQERPGLPFTNAGLLDEAVPLLERTSPPSAARRVAPVHAGSRQQPGSRLSAGRSGGRCAAAV